MITAPVPHVEAVVIGAGVIGLAVARAFAMAGRDVLLIERHASVGNETSSRNSQVIHAGLYYAQNSWKAKFCVEGRHMMYQYCHERAVEVKQCGKLIVAPCRDQLVPLYHQALRNGVSDAQLLSAEQVHDLEPELCAPALWSPSTGIVDSHEFMYRLWADAEAHGATIALNSPVEDVRILRDSRMELQVDGMWISCSQVVNAAGLGADRIAAMMHRNHPYQPPRQYYCKGNYFRLQGQKAPFSRLVYPLPDKRGGLGVHATIDLAGSVRFGPDIEWLHEDTQSDDIDYKVNDDRAKLFYNAIRNYWPNLQDGTLVPDYAGVRPKLGHPSTHQMKEQDFLILGPKEHGVPGLIHLLGMESPGFTSSMAIAKYIVSEKLGGS